MAFSLRDQDVRPSQDIDARSLLELMQEHGVEFGGEPVFVRLEVFEELELGGRFNLPQNLLVLLLLFFHIPHDVLRKVINLEGLSLEVIFEFFQDRGILEV